ncbi:MAG: pitrilysin family protein, partial [Planctomycetota bacterium]|nr:pitrilysin family protein [Planctomycetota bacterium]
MLSLFLLPALLLPQSEDGFSALAEEVEMKVLDNGLRVLALPHGDAPVVAFHVYVRTGAMDEEAGLTGLAHFAEHMAFKGSDRIGAVNWRAEQEALLRSDQAWTAYEHALTAPAGEYEEDEVVALKKRFESLNQRAVDLADAGAFDRAVEVAGGKDQNATTGADATRYFVSLPSNRMETWFWLTREQIGAPCMREFYQERDVVMEERRMRTDSSPVGGAVEALMNAAFVAHPYRDSTIGHMDDLLHLDRPEMIRFWQRHYTADRIVVAVVGKLDPDDVFDFAERYFGDLPEGEHPRPRRTVEPPQMGERILEMHRPTSPMVVAGWHVPALTGRVWLVHLALNEILFGGPSSRVFEHLVKKEQIAAAVEGYPGFPGRIDPTLFLSILVPLPGKSPQECMAAAQDAIANFARDGATDRQLEGVRRRLKLNLLSKLETPSGLASALAEAEAEDGGWSSLFESLAVLEGIQSSDLQAAAKRLQREQRTTVYLLPPDMTISGE